MKQRKKSFGMKISAFVLSFAMVCTLLAGVNVVAFAADDLDDSVNVMRFNSTMTGEHIFTANDGEINYYNGMQPVWQNEGVAWKAPLYSESGVYRIFNNLTFEHMWTTDAFEVFINTTYGPWTLEQDPAFYSADSTGDPVYRLSKKGYEGYGAHHYTVNETERFWLLASGEWNDEGVAFYGVKEEPAVYSLEATQTDADEITVTSPDGEFTGLETFSVSHNGVADELADLEYVEELDAYTITLANPIEDAIYTVKCSDSDFASVTFQGKEYGEKEMVAVQTAANKVTVTSLTPFAEDDEFEVTRGTFEEAVINTEFDDDNCTVVLTLDSNIQEATYTVTCSDEEYDAAEFDGEEAEVTYFKFADDKLIASDSTMYTAKVGFATLDQWGNYIVDDSLVANPEDAFTAAGGKVLTAVYYDEDNDDDQVPGTGALVVMAPGASIDDAGEFVGTPFTVGSEVTATVVYAGDTKVEQAKFTVNASGVVSNIMVLDPILNPENGNYDDFVTERRTTSRMSIYSADENGTAYLLPLMAFDQYGNTLNAAQLNAMMGNSLYVTPVADIEYRTIGTVTYPVVTSSGIAQVVDIGKLADPTGDSKFFTDAENGAVVLNIVGDGNARSYGSGIINFLSTSGFTTTKTIDVEENEKIDTLNVTVDDLVVNKAKTVTLSATDQYGDAVDLDDCTILANGNTLTIIDENANTSTVKATNAEFDKDATTGEVTLTANVPTATIAVLTTQTATNKVSTQQKKINPAATVAKIKGFADSVQTTISAQGQYSTIDVSNSSNFVFVDTYGDVVDSSEVGYGEATGTQQYYYTVTANTSNFTVLTGGTISVKPNVTNAGSDTFTAKLFKADGTRISSTANLKVTVAGPAKSYAAFVKPGDELLYVKGGSADTATIGLYGIDDKGNTFVVRPGVYKVNVDSGLAVTGSCVIVGNNAMTLPDNYTGTAIAKVLVGSSIVDEVEVNFSNVAPVATIGMIYEAKDVGNPTTWTVTTTDSIIALDDISVDYAGNTLKLIVDDEGAGYVIQILDQYNQVATVNEIYATDGDVEYDQSDIDTATIYATYDEDDAILIIVESGDESVVFTVNGASFTDPTQP